MGLLLQQMALSAVPRSGHCNSCTMAYTCKLLTELPRDVLGMHLCRCIEPRHSGYTASLQTVLRPGVLDTFQTTPHVGLHENVFQPHAPPTATSSDRAGSYRRVPAVCRHTAAATAATSTAAASAVSRRCRRASPWSTAPTNATASSPSTSHSTSSRTAERLCTAAPSRSSSTPTTTRSTTMRTPSSATPSRTLTASMRGTSRMSSAPACRDRPPHPN